VNLQVIKPRLQGSYNVVMKGIVIIRRLWGGNEFGYGIVTNSIFSTASAPCFIAHDVQRDQFCHKILNAAERQALTFAVSTKAACLKG
jgi:hypothetical protein